MDFRGNNSRSLNTCVLCLRKYECYPPGEVVCYGRFHSSFVFNTIKKLALKRKPLLLKSDETESESWQKEHENYVHLWQDTWDGDKTINGFNEWTANIFSGEQKSTCRGCHDNLVFHIYQYYYNGEYENNVEYKECDI